MPRGADHAPSREKDAPRRLEWAPGLLVLLASGWLAACGGEDGQSGPQGNFTLVAAGDDHSCGVLEGGQEVWCWGANGDGQLGDGTTVSTHRPSQVFVPGVVLALSLGGSHSCALVESGTVFCWGRNDEGQLGDGSTTSRSTASPVVGLMHAVDVSAGYRHTCAVESGGRLLCWGSNDTGQLGLGDGAGPDLCGTAPSWPCSLVPSSVLSLTNVTQVAAGGDSEGSHTCALDDLFRVWCWGDNAEMQLGDGTQVSRNRPVQVTDVSGVQALSAGGAHACVLLADLTIMCWGRRYGSLFPITLLEGVAAVTSGRDFDCARLEDGSLHCWGDNDDGQLGDGTRGDRVIPAHIPDMLFLAAAHGAGHSCAIDDVAQVWCWGRNTDGQLGGSQIQFSTTPVPLIAPESD